MTAAERLSLPLIVGNWKMHKTRAEAELLARAFVREMGGTTNVEVVLCPPFTALSVVGEVIRDSELLLGAQNMHWEMSGAFTGEISGLFLKELGCSYVIIGHSERRQHFGETDEMIARKVRAALLTGLVPIVCIGETLAERQAGQTEERLRAQFEQGIAPAGDEDATLVIAYEPVWAIGSGEPASVGQAAAAHQFIRQLAAEQLGAAWARGLRIIYGGSVTAENSQGFLAAPEVNGLLVGGASLKKDFVRIVQLAAGL